MEDEVKSEVAVKPEGNLVSAPPATGFGAGDDILASDLRIGRIAIQQSGSDLVKADKARQGAIVNVDMGKELGYKEKPFFFIPIRSVKYWVETDADTRDFIDKYPGVSDDEHPREERVGNINVKRMFHHAFYVLVPDEIKEMDEMVYEVTFRSTDLKEAKKLSSLLFKLRKRGEPSWNRVFEMRAILKTKDKDTWFGANISLGRDTTEEERKVAKGWYETVMAPGVDLAKNTNIYVDDKNEVSENSDY